MARRKSRAEVKRSRFRFFGSLLSSRSVDFADRVIEGHAPPEATIRLRPHVPLRSISAECDPAYATVAVSGAEADDAKLLLIKLSPALKRGEFSFAVRIRAEDTHGENIPPQAIEVAGDVLPNVRPSPRAIDLGLVESSRAAAADLLLTSQNGKSFHLDGLEAPVGVRAHGDDPVDSLSHVVSVVLEHRHPGAISEKLLVPIRYADGSGDRIIVPIHGYVAAGAMIAGDDRRTLQPIEGP